MPLIIVPLPAPDPLHGAKLAGMQRHEMACFIRNVITTLIDSMNEEELQGYVDDAARQWVISTADEDNLPKDQADLDARAIMVLETFTRAHRGETAPAKGN